MFWGFIYFFFFEFTFSKIVYRHAHMSLEIIETFAFTLFA